MKLIVFVLTAWVISVSTQAQLFKQWEVYLSPDIGSSPVHGIATLNYGEDFITYGVTYDGPAVSLLEAPSFHVQVGSSWNGVDLDGSGAQQWTKGLYWGNEIWESGLDGAFGFVYCPNPDRYVAQGTWALTFLDTKGPDVPPIVDPPYPGGGDDVGGGGEIPELPGFALLSALGLLGFMAGRRLCHA